MERVLNFQESSRSQESRAVARSENPGGHVILGGDNVPSLVEIGLADLPKSGGAQAPPAPPLATGLGQQTTPLVSSLKYQFDN